MAARRVAGARSSEHEACRRVVHGSTAHCAGGPEVSLSVPEAALPEQIPRYEAPQPTGASLWHDVELHVKTWLDEDTGLFRYVNEMPMGSLQKFEVQPHLPGNAIEEDPKGSARLAAFGQPVPFNYGCLPQTFRDPTTLCEHYGAPGDDDPLDILDLGGRAVGVGEVAQCRPLGAVCLIDEGQADWKILAVNTQDDGPLAQARSVEDVERIAPGRVAECLKWIDDFKQSSGKGEAKLHFEIHGAEVARKLIGGDHASWRRLVSEVSTEGTARGHWVGGPQVWKLHALPWLPVSGGVARTRRPDPMAARPSEEALLLLETQAVASRGAHVERRQPPQATGG